MEVYKNKERVDVTQVSKCESKSPLNGNSSPEAHLVPYEDIEKHVEALRVLKMSIVLTSGTFDLTHIGHAKFLEKAKSFGDALIIGIDSDEKVRKRKGPERPIVPEDERSIMIASLRSADIVTIKGANEPKWELIKKVCPDTLIVTQETYTDEQLQELCEYCGQIVSLEPQATTSTSAKIRKLRLDWANKIIQPIEEMCAEHGASEELIQKIGKFLLDHKNG